MCGWPARPCNIMIRRHDECGIRISEVRPDKGTLIVAAALRRLESKFSVNMQLLCSEACSSNICYRYQLLVPANMQRPGRIHRGSAHESMVSEHKTWSKRCRRY